MAMFDRPTKATASDAMYAPATKSRWDVIGADVTAGFYNDGIVGAFKSKLESIDYLNAEMDKVDGQTTENPLRSSETYKTADPMAEWEANREKRADANPHRRGLFERSYTNKAAGIRRGTQLHAEKIYERAPSGLLTGGARFLGQTAGFLSDPINLGATVATGGIGGAARVGVMGLVKNALKIAAVNGGIEAAQLPLIAHWRKQTALQSAELDPGWGEVTTGEAAMRIGGAAIVTGGADMIFRGAYRAGMKSAGKVPLRNSKGQVYGYAKSDESNIISVATPEGAVEVAVDKLDENVLKKIMLSEGNLASPEDVKAALKAAGADNDPGMKALGELFEDAEDTRVHLREADQAADARSLEETLQQTERHLNEPHVEPRPDEVLTNLPKAKRTEVNKSDTTAGVDVYHGSVHMERGKPIHGREIHLHKAKFDAVRFQFKSGGDARGKTGKLNAKTWSEVAAGRPLMFEPLDDPDLIFADGHQRGNFAHELAAQGNPPPPVLGFVYREADGWTAGEVRALAAKKNLQEGHANAIDAAKIMREHPDLLDDSISLSEDMMQMAVHLARLEDEAFDMVAAGLIKPSHARQVAQYAGNPARHKGMMEELIKARPVSADEARIMVNEMRDLPDMVETQMDLLGARNVATPVWRERVRLINEAKKLIARNSKVFKVLQTEANTIEAGGNTLNRAANKNAAQKAAQVEEIIEKSAQTRGPMGDKATELSAQVMKGEKSLNAAAKEFNDAVGEALEAGGVAGLFKKHEPQTPSAVHADPVTNADAIGDGLTMEMFGHKGLPESAATVKPKAKGGASGKKGAMSDAGEIKATPAEVAAAKEQATQMKMREAIDKLKSEGQSDAAEDLEKALGHRKIADVIGTCGL